MNIENYDEIVEQLEAELKKIAFEIPCNCNTDIIIRVDPETENAELSTYDYFGSYWIDDDWYTIYTATQNYEDIWYYWGTIEEIAGALEIPAAELKKAAAEYSDIDPEDVGYRNVTRYVDNQQDLADKINAATWDYINVDLANVIHEQATDIINEFMTNH